MPHEKIISGDLDGDGVEGHRKKISGGEFPRKKKGEAGSDPVSGSPSSYSGQNRTEETDQNDPFFTDFGSIKPRGSEMPNKRSVIEDDSDIFQTGFGSVRQQKRDKIFHASGHHDQGHTEKKGTPVHRTSQFTEEETDELFESASPLPDEQEKDSKKHQSLYEDPFYTGFGYTDQRGEGSPADGRLFPDADVLPEMPEKEPEPEIESDLKEEEPEEEIAPEPPVPEKPKKSSVLIRDDDDLFS